MKTFSQYAQEKSIQNLAHTLVENGYDVDEVTGYVQYIIENTNSNEGEVILNELLSGLMNLGRGLVGGAASGVRQGANAIGSGIKQGANAIGGGIKQGVNAVGSGLGAAGQYAADKYKQGEQGSQIGAAVKQLNGVSQTLQRLGVTNPEVQKLFAALNQHLTQLSGQVSGDRKARFGTMPMQMPGATA